MSAFDGPINTIQSRDSVKGKLDVDRVLLHLRNHQTFSDHKDSSMLVGVGWRSYHVDVAIACGPWAGCDATKQDILPTQPTSRSSLAVTLKFLLLLALNIATFTGNLYKAVPRL